MYSGQRVTTVNICTFIKRFMVLYLFVVVLVVVEMMMMMMMVKVLFPFFFIPFPGHSADFLWFSVAFGWNV